MFEIEGSLLDPAVYPFLPASVYSDAVRIAEARCAIYDCFEEIPSPARETILDALADAESGLAYLAGKLYPEGVM